MIKSQAKRFELNFLLKLSDLKSNFTLTLGYLNPALNNPGQENFFHPLTPMDDKTEFLLTVSVQYQPDR